jgi:hypothetical protein
MKHRQWLSIFAIALVLLSLSLFTLHYLIFQDIHHILIYTVHDFAFLPIEVLLVTIVIHSLLERQNLQHKLEKLNVVIGTFYSGVGNQLLKEFVRYDKNVDLKKNDLMVSSSWTAADFKMHRKNAAKFVYDIDITRVNIEELYSILLKHEDFLLRILENPVMLEHESFTDVLRAVFHLTEEMKNRNDLSNLPDTDRAHLSGDIKRAYSLLTLSWLDYMQYLHDEYPYLFSLAMRLNPFCQNGDACVRE